MKESTDAGGVVARLTVLVAVSSNRVRMANALPTTRRTRPKLPTERVRVRRRPQRAAYDRATIDAILDEGLVAHVGIATAEGPVVLPVAYARDGERVLVHGAVESRLMRALGDGTPCCLTVTLLDGLVLAKSVFHHSMNYRSVIVLGCARELVDPADKTRALERIVEHLVPGRTREARAPYPRELAATRVLALPLDESSAKIRSGPPVDDDDDHSLPVWSGVLPIATQRPQYERGQR